jgi:hypothetical protein
MRAPGYRGREARIRRHRDKARANNSAADLVTVMARSLADPDNSPGGRPRRPIIPAGWPARKGPAPAVLRHYAFHCCQMTDHTPETTFSV